MSSISTFLLLLTRLTKSDQSDHSLPFLSFPLQLFFVLSPRSRIKFWMFMRITPISDRNIVHILLSMNHDRNMKISRWILLKAVTLKSRSKHIFTKNSLYILKYVLAPYMVDGWCSLLLDEISLYDHHLNIKLFRVYKVRKDIYILLYCSSLRHANGLSWFTSTITNKIAS